MYNQMQENIKEQIDGYLAFSLFLWRWKWTVAKVRLKVKMEAIEEALMGLVLPARPFNLTIKVYK